MNENNEKAQTLDFNRARIVSTYNELTRQFDEGNDVFSKLTRKLQTTLDANKLIAIYAEELKTIVDFQQLTFTDSDSISVQIGSRAGTHSCNFNLKLDQTELGSLTLSRKKRFIEEELSIIECLIGTLVFPLNNAKLYRTALHSALRDELTGLGNKRALQADLHREAGRSIRHLNPLSVIILDIDHFKKINDSFGHLAGDQALKSLAQTLKACARNSDLCFRYGGEEFLVILDNTSEHHAKEVAERFRKVIEAQNFYFGSKKIPITASFGCATFKPGESLENFIGRADKALYTAKEGGRNKVVAHGDLAEEDTLESKEQTAKSASA